MHAAKCNEKLGDMITKLDVLTSMVADSTIILKDTKIRELNSKVDAITKILRGSVNITKSYVDVTSTNSKTPSTVIEIATRLACKQIKRKIKGEMC